MAEVLLPKTYKYKQTRFWPEGGMIWIEDLDTGQADAITRKDALLRAKAVNDMINFYPHPSERDEQHKLVENLIECVRTAKDQGDPTDLEVRAQKTKELQRSRKARILLPPKGFSLKSNDKPLQVPGLRNLDL